MESAPTVNRRNRRGAFYIYSASGLCIFTAVLLFAGEPCGSGNVPGRDKFLPYDLIIIPQTGGRVKMKTYPFSALFSRMKYITRWCLMRSTRPEALDDGGKPVRGL